MVFIDVEKKYKVYTNMKRRLILFIAVVILFSLNGCSESDPVETDQKKEIFFDFDDITIPNDSIAYHKRDMTRVTGLVKDFDKYITFKANYKNGRLHGLKQTWFWGGVLKSEGFYVNGKKEGVHRFWFSSRQLKARLEYHNDGLQGVQKSWYENGQISAEISYKDGFEHGVSKSWYENG